MLLISSEAFDTERLVSVLDKLKHSQAVDIPKYDFKGYKNDVFPARRVFTMFSYLNLNGIMFNDFQVIHAVYFSCGLSSSVMLPIYVFLMCFAGKPCRCYNFGRHPCFP
jgi:hypothetical protein